MKLSLLRLLTTPLFTCSSTPLIMFIAYTTKDKNGPVHIGMSLPACLQLFLRVQLPYWVCFQGGGTAAHLMLELWPSLELEGWEIDEILIDKAREYLGLSDLENHTPAGGILHVRIGDALSPSVHVPGGYAGIVIDLFTDGKVLPQLTEVATWLKLNDKLMPNGRLMVNCGAGQYEVPDTLYPETSSDDAWEKNLSLRAMCQAFPGQLMNWKKMPKEEGENYLALTGPLPDLNAWSASVPDRLRLSVNQWRPCFPR